MTPEIDALSSYAAIALNAPLDDETPSPAAEVRQLAIRALTDAAELRVAFETSRAKCEAALEKHHELIALADRMDACEVATVTGASLALVIDGALRAFDAAAGDGAIRPIA